MEHIRGVVERITYQNTENGFSVIKCRVKNYTDLVTVVGAMPEVHVGSVLYMGGSWKVDGKYGRQFSMETFEETLPATVYGIEKYLGSGLVKGIGPKYAKKIVGTFGAETLNVIEEDPDKLDEIPGIGKKRVERIKKSWIEQKEIKNIMLFLQGHDVSTAHATKIYKTYGNDSIKTVQENPYKLADDIWGIGFKTADTIAEKMGFGHEKYARLRSGIMYTLNKLSEEGHCYATSEMLLKTGSELLGVDDSLLTMTLDEMIRAKDVIVEELTPDDPQEGENGKQAELKRAIYLPPFYFSEVGVAKRLKSIYTNPCGFKVSTDNLAAKIASKTGMQYDDVQMQAIYSTVQNKLLVLTGGPGTGKTTTTLGIITAFRSAGARILLAAPTGRAAKRLSEATHMEAKTIHRLLEYKPPEGYQRNEENPLEGDVLIVDECSMIDVMLMYNLLKAVPDTMTVILVGDIDQLPSVGAGNVLRDIIDSGCFPVVRLTRIFRQAQSSRIIMNAHRINKGQMPDISNGKNSDFFFIDVDKMAADEGLAADDTAAIAELAGREIVKLVKSNLSRYYHIPSIQIQVLTPMQRGAVGASTLNQKLQEALNPEGAGLRRGGIMYKTNDKVMQIRNNYDKEVFNGDIGVISSVDLEDRSLKVKFDEREVAYDISELDELVLAYATTIHKAQGSEYPIVVMPVMMNHFVMLQRNLIYTGITRAKKILVIVGTRKALRYAVKNVTVSRRNTLLRQRLQEALPLVDTVHTGMKEEVKKAEPEVKWMRPERKRAEQGIKRVEQEAKRVKQEANREEQETTKAVRIEPPKPTHEEWLKEDLWVRLSRSNFRSRFHLKEKDKTYVKEKGYDTIRSHAEDFVAKRLAPAVIPNDGKQTPMRGHPVFIAQHATACCCRGCLFKWHGIPEGRALTKDEQEYVVGVLMTWIKREMDR